MELFEGLTTNEEEVVAVDQVLEINKDLFMADYNALLDKKESVIDNCKAETDKLNASDELKAQVLELLVKEQTVELDKEISFYEKYIIKGEN